MKNKNTNKKGQKMERKTVLKKAFSQYAEVKKTRVIVKEVFSIGIERTQERTFDNEIQANEYKKTLRIMNPEISITTVKG